MKNCRERFWLIVLFNVRDCYCDLFKDFEELINTIFQLKDNFLSDRIDDIWNDGDFLGLISHEVVVSFFNGILEKIIFLFYLVPNYLKYRYC